MIRGEQGKEWKGGEGGGEGSVPRAPRASKILLCSYPYLAPLREKYFPMCLGDDLYSHTLCLKKTLMLHTNFNAHQPIVVIFGKDVAERVCCQMMICYRTSPN